MIPELLNQDYAIRWSMKWDRAARHTPNEGERELRQDIARRFREYGVMKKCRKCVMRCKQANALEVFTFYCRHYKE